MIFLKNDEEIAIIKQSGLILAQAFGVVAKAIKPGVATKTLDKLAETYIYDHGAIPSFKGYDQFPATLCVSVNEAVVHGIPGDYELKEGDIVSVDGGVFYKGFHSDSAFTFPVGEITKEAKELIKVTKEALYLGINQAIVGNRIGDIGGTVEDYVSKHNFTVVRNLAGHGIGKNLHEDPQVPNYGKLGSGVRLKKGMVLAIEPMVNVGRSAVKQEKDGWTITTIDKKLSAHFEHTIAVGEQQAEILTSYQYIEEVFRI
ncbi:methionine aminopeptidase, type I [Candidatus Amoebophilus asiaticus 5a2]|uniref:Methionine aminopeptidase n=1 Tax=Amoebophilus asiaticus (strain 5a2) TaxID=452471 RepID=B3EUK2_AMOA5|nr:type I methionyl aminopeptidase [Candidatus Amoebophilus asiaticus]ACE05621.1 methionine aminopeptidase, type I [Candidatus Amoebophilus asiaticus 5a2]